MYCLIIILSLWLVRSGAQQVGQLIGPAVDDPRAMLGQENFPPGGALGNAYYGLLTAYGGASDNMSPNNPSFGVLEGGCGYYLMDRTRWPYWNAVAVRPDSPLLNSATRPTLGCGMCVQITCVDPRFCKTKYPIVAQITDNCPGCTNAMHMDGHASWVNELLSVANALIKVQRVHCMAKQTELHVVVMDYTGPFQWLRMRLEKLRGRGITRRVQIQDQAMSATGTWIDLTNTWGTVWEMHNTPRSTVVRFRITNDSNAVRVTTWLTIAAGRFRSTGTQFWGRALSGITYGAPTWTQCRDVPPDSSATCAQQKSWGQCSQPWMKQPIPTQWGYCALTCGRCSLSGRKLLVNAPEIINTTSEPSAQKYSQKNYSEQIYSQQGQTVEDGEDGDGNDNRDANDNRDGKDRDAKEDAKAAAVPVTRKVKDGDIRGYYPGDEKAWEEFLTIAAKHNVSGVASRFGKRAKPGH